MAPFFAPTDALITAVAYQGLPANHTHLAASAGCHHPWRLLFYLMSIRSSMGGQAYA